MTDVLPTTRDEFRKFVRSKKLTGEQANHARLVALDLEILERTQGRIPAINALVAANVASFAAAIQ